MQKNGFKDWKFGQSWESVTNPNPGFYPIEGKPNILIYLGTSPSSLSGFKWRDLKVTFCDNKLKSFQIIFNESKSNPLVFTKLKVDLQSLFGTPLPYDSPDVIDAAVWMSDKIHLQLFHLPEGTNMSNYGAAHIIMWIKSVEIERQCAAKGF